MPFADWNMKPTGWGPDGVNPTGWEPDGMQPFMGGMSGGMGGLFGGMNDGSQFGEMPPFKQPAYQPPSQILGRYPMQQPQMSNWLEGAGMQLPQFQPPQQRVDTFGQMFGNMGIPQRVDTFADMFNNMGVVPQQQGMQQMQQPQQPRRRGLFGGARNRLMDTPYGTV